MNNVNKPKFFILLMVTSTPKGLKFQILIICVSLKLLTDFVSALNFKS